MGTVGIKGAWTQWLVLQRLVLYSYILIGVVLVIYSLGFLTNEYVFYAYGDKELINFYHDMQWLNKELLAKALVLIVLGVLLCLLQIQNHIVGIISLIIALICVVISVTFTIICISDLVLLRDDYLNLDFSVLEHYIERGTIRYKEGTFTFDLGIFLWALGGLVSVVLGGVLFFNACKIEEVR